MSAPDASRWGSRPGGLDALHMERRFPEEPTWGIPIVRGAEAVQPEALLPWTSRKAAADEVLATAAWHFFADDYRFEPLWKRPDQYAAAVARAASVLTPDFSVYRDWPCAAQLWNTYRGRWLGALWEAAGRVVVPTVNWGDWRTYDFCFAGIEPGATVAVSTQGTREPAARRLFRAGFEAMLGALRPSLVLVYGERVAGLGLEEADCPLAAYAPNGMLEMRARLTAAQDRRQCKLFAE